MTACQDEGDLWGSEVSELGRQGCDRILRSTQIHHKLLQPPRPHTFSSVLFMVKAHPGYNSARAKVGVAAKGLRSPPYNRISALFDSTRVCSRTVQVEFKNVRDLYSVA